MTSSSSSSSSSSDDSFTTLRREMFKAAQRLRQFGRLAAGRLFGTLPNADGRYLAVVDEWERSLLVRAEASGLSRVLIEKGIISRAEWVAIVLEEYRALGDAIEKTWPELRVDDIGIHITDPAAFAARAKREGWPK